MRRCFAESQGAAAWRSAAPQRRRWDLTAAEVRGERHGRAVADAGALAEEGQGGPPREQPATCCRVFGHSLTWSRHLRSKLQLPAYGSKTVGSSSFPYCLLAALLGGARLGRRLALAAAAVGAVALAALPLAVAAAPGDAPGHRHVVRELRETMTIVMHKA